MKFTLTDANKKLNGSFGNNHPAAEAFYLISMITISLIVKHPVYLSFCLFGGIACSVSLCGLKNLQVVLIISIPALILFTAVNPLFSHFGITRLFKLPDGNYVTLESVIYGLLSGVMFISIVIWFISFNRLMSPDKLFYLLGSILPQTALLFVMILRFIPSFIHQAETVKTARECLDGTSENKKMKRYSENIKKGSRILNVMIGWSLENGMEISDSMNAKGYGVEKRTSYLLYKTDKGTVVFSSIMIFFLSAVIFGLSQGSAYFDVNPIIDIKTPKTFDFFIMAVFLIYCFIPIIINFFISSKILLRGRYEN